MRKNNTKIKQLINLNKQIKKLPISSVEKEFLNSEQQFEATYYSNRLEGNKLTKTEARKAISIL